MILISRILIYKVCFYVLAPKIKLSLQVEVAAGKRRTSIISMKVKCIYLSAYIIRYFQIFKRINCISNNFTIFLSNVSPSLFSDTATAFQLSIDCLLCNF